MPKRVPVLIPQSLQLGFMQISPYLRRKWITTYMGAFAQEFPKVLKTFVFNEFIHQRVQGFRSIFAEGILDEETGILIYINFRSVDRRLINKCLYNDALVH
jgi:hypothetical protein